MYIPLAVFAGAALAAIARLTQHQWREVRGDRGFAALRPLAPSDA